MSTKRSSTRQAQTRTGAGSLLPRSWGDAGALDETDQLLFGTDTVQVCRFSCPEGSPLWRDENRPRAACMVFAWRGVEITQAGRDPVVANPNHVVFHNRGTAYRRRPVVDGGEESVFIRFVPEVWAELVSVVDPGEMWNPEHPFRHIDAPCTSSEFMRQHAMQHSLERGSGVDAVAVEEVAFALARSSLRRAYEARGQHRPRRRDTARAHRDAVHEAKLYLTAHFAEPVTLGDVARHVHLSAYHLSRVFRAETGFTVHRYLRCLRLCSSLGMLRERVGISSVARRHGFASHAHFTGAFGREFGVTPSGYRSGLSEIDPERVALLSKITQV